MKKGFSKIIILCIIVILGIITVMALYEEEVIRTYKIKDFEVHAVVNKDGSMTVKEITEYRFNGKYNGITITIPKNINQSYYEKMTKNSINDSIQKDYWYNNKGLKNVKIYVVDENGNRNFNRVGTADLGADSVYTVSEDDDGYITYKIFEPSKNENKTFVIEYTLEDVAVKHKDCGEVWWNFIGGGVECKIDRFRINISTAFGNILEGYIHSNESGKVNSINRNNLRATVSGIRKNEFVGIRLVFPESSISNSVKFSGVNALDTIHEQEKNYDNKSNVRIVLNIVTILITAGLLFYWLYLIIRYEKEFVFTPENIDDIAILEKYNPMIAACIAQNRDMHPRDILAVLIDLVNRKILDMEAIKSIDSKKGKEYITYRLTKNDEFFKMMGNYADLDPIERNVLDIFFEGRKSINLERKLLDIKTNKKIAKKIKLLDEMVSNKLEEIGANFVRVPQRLLILNNFIAILCIIYILFVIGFNVTLGLSTLSTSAQHIKETAITIAMIFGGIALSALPIVLYGILLILKIANGIKKAFSKLSFKLTSKKFTQSIIQNIMIFALIFVLEFIFFRHSYIIICTMLFMMSMLIIFTDNLMSSHSMKIRNDYFTLKMLEDKILNGSMLEEKQIKDQVLWEKYLAFAIALGVGDVAKLVKGIPAFDYFESCIDDFENIYDLYYNSRDDMTSRSIEKFESVISKMMESSSSGGYSSGSSFRSGGFSGGSSFGGGGFSGGGRRRRTEEERFRKNEIVKYARFSCIFFCVYI